MNIAEQSQSATAMMFIEYEWYHSFIGVVSPVPTGYHRFSNASSTRGDDSREIEFSQLFAAIAWRQAAFHETNAALSRLMALPGTPSANAFTIPDDYIIYICAL